MQRSIAQLSGGEKKRMALALGLGFAEVVAARGRLSSNILVLDEVSSTVRLYRAALGCEEVEGAAQLCQVVWALLRLQQHEDGLPATFLRRLGCTGRLSLGGWRGARCGSTVSGRA
jgi:recombinational DNA repair ATPase RecF